MAKATAATSMPRPRSATRRSVLSRGIAPKNRGIANSGNARIVPALMMLTVVMPVATRPPRTPAWTSIWYWSAPADAAPPGTMRPKALLASWEAPITNQLRTCSTTRYSTHTQAKLPATAATMATYQPGSMTRSRGRGEDVHETRPYDVEADERQDKKGDAQDDDPERPPARLDSGPGASGGSLGPPVNGGSATRPATAARPHPTPAATR